MKKAISIAVLLTVAVLILLPILRTSERTDLSSEARSRVPGGALTLSHGTVHYEMAGSSNRHTVVLVHGFSVPSYVWDPTFTALVNAGFRVVRYDLYGRGYSDRPHVSYNRQLFVDQLRELLDVLRLDDPVDIIGLSMGGAVAAAFSADHPGRVRRLVLIAPFNAPQDIGPLRFPVLGEYVANAFFVPSLPEAQLKDFLEPERFPNWAEWYKEQMQYRGFANAVLSTVRNFVTKDPMPDFRVVGGQRRPVLLVWGEDDQTVPFTQSDRVRRALPDAEFFPVPRARHLPHLEREGIVNAALIAFLQAQ